jgi:hypothetical protein
MSSTLMAHRDYVSLPLTESGACHGQSRRCAGVPDRHYRMATAGMIDSAEIPSAALALTVDVLIHTRLPELSFEP